MISCSSSNYNKTVQKVDIKKFMGSWYVLAGRFTIFERGAHNAIENYSYNALKDQIDIDFKFRKNSFDGETKSIPQTGWIHNKETNSHWKVSPFWPLKLDFIIIALADDYSWTAIGVPSQKYLWIMAREYNGASQIVDTALKTLSVEGYDISNISTVSHRY